MAMVLRQMVAACLTVTMFVMLGNMIKRDHFDSLQVDVATVSTVRYEEVKVKEGSHITVSSVNKTQVNYKAHRRGHGQALEPCWEPPLKESKSSQGSITFMLNNGPEYHVLQIADAVVTARYLGANLVLPHIMGSEPGDNRKFEEIYDVENFVRSLDGVVRVVKDHPLSEVSTERRVLVRVPNRVSKKYIASNIESIFRRNSSLRLQTYFPSIGMRKTENSMKLDSSACLAMFRALQLQSELQNVVDSMIRRLSTSSHKWNGWFIAVDLKECRGSAVTFGMKSCYNAEEVGNFLRKIGFDGDTTIYLTSPVRSTSFNTLKQMFPNTYTKEDIMTRDEKAKFLHSRTKEFEKVIDFYMCSQSDVFVPSTSGLFYNSVAGMRIFRGKTKILIPAKIIPGSASASDYLSPYIYNKNHVAYSCFC